MTWGDILAEWPVLESRGNQAKWLSSVSLLPSPGPLVPIESLPATLSPSQREAGVRFSAWGRLNRPGVWEFLKGMPSQNPHRGEKAHPYSWCTVLRDEWDPGVPGNQHFLEGEWQGWLPRVVSGEAVRKLGLIWRSLGHLCWASSFGWLIFQLTWKFLGFSTECSTSQETPPICGSLPSWSPYLLLPSRSPVFLRPETHPPPKALRVPQN